MVYKKKTPCSEMVNLNIHILKEISLKFLRKSFSVSNGRVFKNNTTAILSQKESDLSFTTQEATQN